MSVFRNLSNKWHLITETRMLILKILCYKRLCTKSFCYLCNVFAASYYTASNILTNLLYEKYRQLPFCGSSSFFPWRRVIGSLWGTYLMSQTNGRVKMNCKDLCVVGRLVRVVFVGAGRQTCGCGHILCRKAACFDGFFVLLCMALSIE